VTGSSPNYLFHIGQRVAERIKRRYFPLLPVYEKAEIHWHSMDHLASLLILTSGLAHAIVNAILKAGKDKMSGWALIDGFSALLIAPVVLFVPLPTHAWGGLLSSWLVHTLYLLCLMTCPLLSVPL
jgi:hypothetical protein